MPILARHALEFFSHSAEQTRRVGVRLGSMLQKGMIICLEGDLGAGKTTLTDGVVQGYGSVERASSPTYVIMNEYRHPGGSRIYHADAYRLAGNNPFDIEMLDLDQNLQNGILILEWAERLQTSLPKEHLWVSIQYLGVDQRHLIFTPRGKAYETIAKKLQQSLFGV
ncbi:MAG: tRNA (adenosine(37)-N6)-threonylcarbamoyltransferase complex ATPase subunit type 1 TsaE [Anaerolineaceae bacterium]|nr:tRNA (adenosine(37)-N6)-threonylcarbamoyltransferase complex ATPase subunit type 1 TsaE [Anaerolineaceae bacterium]